MKKYIFIIAISILTWFNVKSQVTINAYEYWFDNAYSNKSETSIASPSVSYQLQDEFPTTSLTNGLHTLNIRFKDSKGNYSSTLSQFFQKLPTSSSASNNIKAYEYWVDNNFSGKTYAGVSPSVSYNLVDSINMSTIANGLHTLHFRFQDERGQWSSVVSQFFQKLPSQTSTNNKIVAYEYWTDNNYSNKTYSATTSNQSINLIDSISMSGLANGLHTYHIRFKDSRGQWSSVLSQFFQKLPAQLNAANSMVSYEYWVDNNYASKVSASTSSSQSFSLIDSLSISSITNGLHTIHFRFKDARGQWSSVLSQFFQKLPAQNNSTNSLSAYEYWIDNNYEGKVSASITANQTFSLVDSLNLTAISNGLHTMHIRFKDTRGQWSTVLSQFFQKLPSQNTAKNNLVAYEYWIDNDYSGKVMTSISQNQTFSLVDSLVLSSLPTGLHTMHIRFKDTRGQWSTVLSQFIQKLPSSNGVINNKIQAYRYWFDDSLETMQNVALKTPVASANIDTLLNVSFIPKGSHVIHFQFKDLIGYWSSVTSDSVYKFATPVASFTHDKHQFCDSSLVAFTNTSFDVDTIISWKFGDGDSSLLENPTHNFNKAGVYSITLIAGDIETTKRDTIYSEVRVGVTPHVDLGKDTAICLGNSITLDAKNPGFSYLWNDQSDSQVITTKLQGQYQVTVTDLYDCADRDTIQILINQLPVVNLGKDTAICTGSSITLDAKNPSYQHLWNDDSKLQTLSVNSQGDYSVKVTDLNQCEKSDTIHITVNPTPVVELGNDTTVICEGTTVVLDAQNNGSTYKWSNLVTEKTTEVGAGGKYYVTVTNSYNCKGSDSIYVKINPLPFFELGKDTVLSQVYSLTLDASVAGVATYKWSTGDQTPTINANANGIYSVVVTQDGCSSIDSIKITIITNTGHPITLGQDLVKVYPVPFHDKMTIEWNSQQETEASFILMDITGKVLQSINKVSVTKGSNSFEINQLDQYAPGTYLLSIKQGKQVTMMKVIRD